MKVLSRMFFLNQPGNTAEQADHQLQAPLATMAYAEKNVAEN